LGKNSIQISKRKHSVIVSIHLGSHKQLELVSHRDIQALKNNVVFSCLDIPVKHSLLLFIYYV
jgi:hypothetical protein